MAAYSFTKKKSDYFSKKEKAKISHNSRQEPERERRDKLERQSCGSRLIRGVTLAVRIEGENNLIKQGL